MATSESFSNLQTYCLITGASQGIGRTCAIEIAKILKEGSVVILVARNETNLNDTKASMAHIPVKVEVYPVDLSKADGNTYTQLIQDSFNVLNVKPSDFDHAMIIHNAGSLGDITRKAIAMDNISSWEDYFRLNVFSMIILNTKFFSFFTEHVKKRTAINITSLCAIQPFKSCSQYCTGKASREMFFKVLALEDPSITVLNYSPGPVETAMIDTLIGDSSDDELRKNYIAMRKERTILTTEQTVNKLIRILVDQKFQSGDHIDYFDVE